MVELNQALVEVNLIEFITIASTGNALDFGGVSQTSRQQAGVSNDTSGICWCISVEQSAS